MWSWGNPLYVVPLAGLEPTSGPQQTDISIH